MSTARVQTVQDPAVESGPACVHYWIIDIPSGPVSNGVCRRCGETREFSNYVDSYTGWDETRYYNHRSPEERYPVRKLVGDSEEAEEG